MQILASLGLDPYDTRTIQEATTSALALLGTHNHDSPFLSQRDWQAERARAVKLGVRVEVMAFPVQLVSLVDGLIGYFIG